MIINPFGLETLQFAKPVLLDGNVVIIVHVVNPDYSCAGQVLEQPLDKVGPYEARRTRDQDGLVFQFNLLHIFLI